MKCMILTVVPNDIISIYVKQISSWIVVAWTMSFEWTVIAHQLSCSTPYC